MTLESKIFLNIDYKKVENEFNKFLSENEIKQEQVVNVRYDNNIIFLVWENNRPSLQQLNKNVDPTPIGTNNTPTYIASGCE